MCVCDTMSFVTLRFICKQKTAYEGRMSDWRSDVCSSDLHWMPVTTSAICLGLGVAIGPAGLELLRLDIADSSAWMEHLTEVAVVFSLFVSGLKLRLPLKHRSWRVAAQLGIIATGRLAAWVG